MKTGQMVMTRGIADKMVSNMRFALEVDLSIRFYMKGNWGTVSEDSKEMNDLNMQSGTGDLLGEYKTCEGRIWIKTEHDRSATTILFPEEY